MDSLHVDLMGPINVNLHGTQKERILSMGGGSYVLVCVEEFSRHVTVVVLRHKSEAAQALVSVIARLQTQTGLKLKRLHSDGGKEFCNTRLEAFLTANGTDHTVTPPHKSELNGIAERMNQTLMEMTRSLLIQSGAPLSLWGEAMRSAAFAFNCTVQPSNGQSSSPSQVLLGKSVDPSRLRVFGCDVWHTLPHVEQAKLGARAQKAMFVGYSIDGLLYRILKPDNTLRLIFTRDVKFMEDSFTVAAELCVSVADQRQADLRSALARSNGVYIDPSLALGHADELQELTRHTVPRQSDDEEVELQERDFPSASPALEPTVVDEPEADFNADNPDSSADDGNHDLSPEPAPSSPEVSSPPPQVADDHPSESTDSSPAPSALSEPEREIEPTAASSPAPAPAASAEPVQLRRSARVRQQTIQPGFINTDIISPSQEQMMFGALVAVAAAAKDAMVDPSSYKQAIARKDAPKWLEAIQGELQSMEKNRVWALVHPPTGATIIRSRWVFKTKLDDHNQPTKWKARLVAKGFQQVQGINFDETYAPVARHKSIKLVMAIVNELDLELKQIDFVTAFLNAPLDYKIYMEQPEGMRTRGDGRVLLLNKALYGLKQSPRQWNLELHNWLTQHGYRPILQDQCIYVKATEKARVIILFLYVDDTGVAYHRKDESVWLADKAALSARFPITDLGDCEWLLGMEVRRDRTQGTLTISQQAYTERVLTQFDLLECKTQPLPLPHRGELERPKDGSDPQPLSDRDKTLYQSIVGSLIYAAALTRMDLMHATAILAKYSAKPMHHHLQAAKHALRYLAGTRDLGLTFRRSNRKLSNLNPAVYPDASWISDVENGRSHSGVITLLNGNPIHWWSKQQSMVALSSTEAEYIALGEAAKDAVWLREWLIAVLGATIPIRMHCDNQATIKIATNDADSARTRHYSARHHYVRQLLKENQLSLEWTNTNEQAADLLTKQLSLDKLKVWRDRFLTPVSLN
jgi:Reverse transcriptase (RNA-dependent DNA polymerase)/Integrase core domain